MEDEIFERQADADGGKGYRVCDRGSEFDIYGDMVSGKN